MSLFSGLTRTLFMASFILLAACGREEKSSVVAVPESWRNMVKTDGQFYPVPAAWLSTPEGRIAHNLKLPDILPKPVPFDFEKAKEMVSENKTKRVSLMYFDHLCATEAGEWIFKKVENVEGLYFARPINQPTDQYLGDLYSPEAPWIERHFQLMGDGVSNSGGQFVDPPAFSYRYVEQPRRDVEWQSDISTPYVRFFGYTSEVVHNPKRGKIPGAQRYLSVTEKTPMQIEGIPEVTAPYVYTWRGITRPRDREYGIAGAELIIHEHSSGEVISVRRTFQITGRNGRVGNSAAWMISPSCHQARDEIGFRTLSEYAVRVLGTIDSSTTGRR